MPRSRHDPDFKAAVLRLLEQAVRQPGMSKAGLGRLLGVSRQAVDQYFKGENIPMLERLSPVVERFPKLEPPPLKGYRFALEAYKRPMKPKRPSAVQLNLGLSDAIRSLSNDKVAVRIVPGRSSSSTVTLEVQVKFAR